MKPCYKLMISGVVMLISGCSTVTGISTNTHELVPGEGSGLLIGSIGIESTMPLHHFDDICLYIDVFPSTIQPEELGKVATISSVRPVNKFFTAIGLFGGIFGGNIVRLDSQFSDQNGQVFALELPPGNYVLKEGRVVKLATNVQNTVGLLYQLTFSPITIELKEGEINYIGNIKMHIQEVKRIYSFSYFTPNKYDVTGITVSVSDRSDRDIPIILETYENMDHTDITKRVVKDVENFSKTKIEPQGT